MKSNKHLVSAVLWTISPVLASETKDISKVLKLVKSTEKKLLYENVISGRIIEVSENINNLVIRNGELFHKISKNIVGFNLL